MKKTLIVMLVMIALIATMTTLVFTSCDSEEDFKVGLICLHDENSPYDANFIDALKAVQKQLGLKDSQIIIKKNIPEDNAAYEAAADLVDQGCDVIFADSFGHQSFILNAAKKFPNVQFCHATGTTAHTDGVKNYHNAFASIYEGRYLAGVTAGVKLKSMIDAGKITTAQAKIGYVGAWPYAEVISGYTSFYLGVKSIVPEVTMEVRYTNSWYDEQAERNTALALIENNCVLISQHADSMGAPSACEERNVPNVSYNVSTAKACPKTYLVSSRIDWAPYFKLAIEATQKGEEFVTDYTGSIATGSVKLTEFGGACVEGTKEAVDAAKAAFADGTLKVFDCSKFTVKNAKAETMKNDKGETVPSYTALAITMDADGHLTQYIADVIDASDYVAETEVVTNGIFAESTLRSAPYFNIVIDGITIGKSVEKK